MGTIDIWIIWVFYVGAVLYSEMVGSSEYPLDASSPSSPISSSDIQKCLQTLPDAQGAGAESPLVVNQ